MSPKESYNNILIILTGSLGDILRAISILPPLRQHYPKARISWLVEKRWAEVVDLCDGLDEVLIFERSISDFPEIVGKIRTRKFDLVLDLQRIFKSGALSFLSGCPERIGFHRINSKELNFLLNTNEIDPADRYFAKIRHYHYFLKKIGVPSSEPYSFPILKSKLKTPADIPADYLGIVLGSSWESKDWLAEGYDQLIKLVLDRFNQKIVLLGDKSKVKLAEHLVSANQCNRVISLCGKTSLTELMGVLASAKAVVGPDSGPGHMSAAVGTPYITLYGPTHPDRVTPYGYEDLSISSPIVCSPCWRRSCPGLNKLCMRLISPESILAILEKLNLNK